jgi:heptosyltransferase-2
MKILVRGTNWIGDAVMSIPALRELRRIFPDAEITLHTRTWADGLFRDASFIDELVTFDKNRWAIKDVLDNSEFLKADEYDLAIVLPNSFESAITSFLAKIPRRIGYNKDLRGLLLTDPVAVPEWKGRRHEVFYYLNLVAETERRMLGRETVAHAEPDPTLDISDERKEQARKMLIDAGAGSAGRTVVFVAGSANSPEKRWPAENFASLAVSLSNNFSANVVLLGSKDDKLVSDQIAGLCAAPLIDLTGSTSLGEAAAILSVADLVVSNDTGLAHVAPAVGTPTVVIFGPTNPTNTRPYSNLAEIIMGPAGGGWPSVEEVFDAAATILSEDINDETAGYIS